MYTFATKSWGRFPHRFYTSFYTTENPSSWGRFRPRNNPSETPAGGPLAGRLAPLQPTKLDQGIARLLYGTKQG
jgi:hypothetical protein